MQIEIAIGTPIFSSVAISRRLRPVERAERARFAVVASQREVGQERERLHPQRDRVRVAGAGRAERGQAEPAVHQSPRDRHQHRDAERAEVHRRPRQRQALGKVLAREEQRERGRAPRDRAHERDRLGHDAGIDVGEAQQRLAPATATVRARRRARARATTPAGTPRRSRRVRPRRRAARPSASPRAARRSRSAAPATQACVPIATAACTCVPRPPASIVSTTFSATEKSWPATIGSASTKVAPASARRRVRRWCVSIGGARRRREGAVS